MFRVHSVSQRPNLNVAGVLVVQEYYACYCCDGFSGEYCEIGPCLTEPCLNDGTCIAVSSSDYTCQCLPGINLSLIHFETGSH